MCRGLPAQPRHSWPVAAAQTDRSLQRSSDVSQVYLISPWYPSGFRICPYSSWLPALWERHRWSVGWSRQRATSACVCVCVFMWWSMCMCVWAVQWSIGKLCQLTCSEWASTAEHLQQLHWQELWNCCCLVAGKQLVTLHVVLFSSDLEQSSLGLIFIAFTSLYLWAFWSFFSPLKIMIALIKICSSKWTLWSLWFIYLSSMIS